MQTQLPTPQRVGSTPRVDTSTALSRCNPLDITALPRVTLLDEAQAAAVLGVAVGTLQVWRSVGRYNLKYRKIGRLVRYAAGDLLDFLESRTRHGHGHAANGGEA